jgi:hypothetical protein
VAGHGGDLDLSDNPGADAIDVGAGQIGGDLVISDDGTAVVNANDSLTVSGDADVETEGGGMLDLSGVNTDGDETVTADGASGVTADTAGGTTDVSIGGSTAAMHVVLPDGTFDHPVAFTITRRGNDPAEGAIDPIGGYAFAFAVPTLNRTRRRHAHGAAGGERHHRDEGRCCRLGLPRVPALHGNADARRQRLRGDDAAEGRRQRRTGRDGARVRALRRHRRALLDLGPWRWSSNPAVQPARPSASRRSARSCAGSSGTFTPAGAAPVKATRRFTVKR